MKTRQSERLKSHRMRHALLVSSPAVAGRKALVRQVAAYGRQLAVIDRLIATQSTRVSPALAGRDAIFAEMVSAALVISGLVRSYLHRAFLSLAASLLAVRHLAPSFC
jgi:hypothetical protein